MFFLLNIMTKKSILITGAGGTVGLLLTKFFLNEGFFIYAIDRSEEAIVRLLDIQNMNEKGKALHILFGDILDEFSVKNFLENKEISYIIHCAALKHFLVGAVFPEKVMAENIEVFNRIKEMAKKQKGLSRVILCSSDKAAKPFSAMAASKKSIEDFSRELNIDGVEFVNIRFANILYSNGSILEKLENHIQQGEAFTIRNKEMTRYVLTKNDVLNLVVYALNHGIHGDIICIKTPAIRITELVEGYLKKRNSSISVVLGENFFSESIHEALFNEEEISCVSRTDHFFTYNRNNRGNLVGGDRDYVLSSEYALSNDALKKIYE